MRDTSFRISSICNLSFREPAQFEGPFIDDILRCTGFSAQIPDLVAGGGTGRVPRRPPPASFRMPTLPKARHILENFGY
jgi:hypothetical protein